MYFPDYKHLLPNTVDYNHVTFLSCLILFLVLHSNRWRNYDINREAGGMSMKDAQCVLWFHETKSPISVQREFQWCYERVPPDIKRTIQMNDKFKETDSVSVLPVSNVDLVRPSYQLDVHQVNREYWLKFIIKYFTCMPLQSMSCKPLSFRCAVNFLIEILGDISMDKVCIYHVSYSYVSGKVNRCK